MRHPLVVRRWLRADRGGALLVVLVLLLALTASAVSFIWFMNQQQTRAGVRYRSMAAMALAEAGVHRALSVLESVTPEDRLPGRHWRPTGYSESVPVGGLEGRFTLSLADEADGAIIVTSVGEVAGVTRRLRARVYLGARALLAALYGVSLLRLESPPAATFILPYGAIGDHPWVHLATGVGFWLGSADVAINDPGLPVHAEAGPVDAPAAVVRVRPPSSTDPIRVLLAHGAGLRTDRHNRPLAVEELRRLGVNLEGFVFQTDELPEAPEVDREFFQAQARLNGANAPINEAAGKYVGDSDLLHKRDSLYSEREFGLLLRYLNARAAGERLLGVVYVEGAVTLGPEQRLEVHDGALLAEGTVRLDRAATLAVTHTAASRTLPGIVTLDKGELLVGPDAHLRVHGLVYASQAFDLMAGADVDIVGSVLAMGVGFSFSNTAATAVIRYDPAVLGTAGLRLPDRAPAIAWVASWEELP